MTVRTGIGHDIHRLAPGRRLVLGGVVVPYAQGLLGHSDADVVLHALCDALLGAAGQPDIGQLFPDGEARWAGADSRQFVAEAMRRVRAAGLVVANADLVVLAEQPRLAPYRAQMIQSLAGLLEVAPQQVGLKAGTNEGLDAVGRGEAIACWASVLLVDMDRRAGSE